MRFFSNEAKDNADEQDTGDRTDSERKEPAAFPAQRAGSPWEHAPGDSADRPPVHDPAPQPTAFGASTVGGAVAASAAAGPYDVDDRRTTDRTTDAASGIADDRTVAFDAGGHSTAAARDAAGRDATGRDDTSDDLADRRGTVDGYATDRQDADGTDTDRNPAAVTADRAADVQVPVRAVVIETDQDKTVALGDRPAPDAEAARRNAEAHQDRTGHDDRTDAVLEDRGTFDDPQVITESGAGKSENDQSVATGGPVSEIGAGEVSGPSPFFPAAETEVLRNRWRDVQLRFVDDPKGATNDAAQLVDEAVDTLTAALREQRGGLAKGTDDTESLRVELRSYRDILDRLLGL
ncbi:hypothetical protein [Actinoplanes sp. DH11]|uniref:hypothetical protein n=1 Tax=Actinoplanes sp. DH11 TaxID=2857011 RepID=UPI001E3179CE|nr:hypothetical protein [Actinoplanes sp. DH11]